MLSLFTKFIKSYFKNYYIISIYEWNIIEKLQITKMLDNMENSNHSLVLFNNINIIYHKIAFQHFKWWNITNQIDKAREKY